jgi:hypothetical protein
MKISPYIIYLEMQPNALLLQQNFIIRKKWVLQRGTVNQVYMPPLLLAHHTSYNSMGYGNRISNGPHDCRGDRNAQGSKAKPIIQVRAVQSI